MSFGGKVDAPARVRAAAAGVLLAAGVMTARSAGADTAAGAAPAGSAAPATTRSVDRRSLATEAQGSARAAPATPRWAVRDPAALPSHEPWPAILPAALGVRDPAFAVLLGVMDADLYGTLGGTRLREEVARLRRPTRLPVDLLVWIRRDRLEGAPGARVSLSATRALDLPVPYRILGYHPGRFRATGHVAFDEWYLGTLRLGLGRGRGEALLEDVRLWGLRSGRLEMDIDGWLDRLMGAGLDDTRLVGLATFRYRGERIGLAMGYNAEGKGRSGAFRFASDGVVYPSPPAFMAAAVHLRGRLERLIPGLR